MQSKLKTPSAGYFVLKVFAICRMSAWSIFNLVCDLLRNSIFVVPVLTAATSLYQTILMYAVGIPYC